MSCFQPTRFLLWKLTAVIFISAITAWAAHAAGQRSAVATRAARGLLIDGHLTEPDWARAKTCGGFFTWNYDTPASPRTRFKILYDDKALYFGITCDELEMDKIRAEGIKRDGRVYPDDHIEIFVEPGSGGGDYFQFMFNTLGTQTDLKGLPGAQEPGWNGDWDVAVTRHKKSWTAEVAIYFHCLGIAPRVKDTWRFNVCRGRRTTPQLQLSTWVQLQGPFHQPGKFARLEGLDADFSAFCYNVSYVQKDSKIREGLLDTAFSISVTNETGRERRVTVEGWLRSPSDKFIVKSLPVTLKKGERKQVRLEGYQVAEQGDHSLFVLVAEAPEGRARRFEEFPVSIEFVPLKITIEDPSYRSTIFATQQTEKIRLAVEAGVERAATGELGLRVLLKDANGKILETTGVPQLKAKLVQVALPCADLPVGDFIITAQLVEKDGKVVAATDHELFKAPPAPGSEVRVDEQLNLIVNGKAIFPLGFYGGGATAGWGREGGFNVSYTGWGSNQNTEAVMKKLDEAHENDITIMVAIFPSTKMMFHKDLSPDDMQAIVKNIRRLKKHPAILGWMMHDEPECGGPPAGTMKKVYDLLRREDPYHPCIVINNTHTGLYSYAETADIFWPDPYPGFRRGGGPIRPITLITLFMDSSAEATKDKKPRWLCPQAMEYRGYDWDRYPTFAEQRCMNYMAINHGCKGILYFQLAAIKNDPDMFMGVPFLAKEIGFLSPVLLFGKRSPVEASPNTIDAAMWQHEGHRYVIAVNTSGETLQGVISLTGVVARQVHVVSENRAIAVTAGGIKDTFGPYETHIYTTNLSKRAPRSMADLTKELTEFKARLHKQGNLAFRASVTLSPGGHRHAPANAQYVTDGIVHKKVDWFSFGWDIRATGKPPVWLELNLGKVQAINKAVVYNDGLRRYQIQYWTGEEWATAAKVADNDKHEAVTTFPAVRTQKVRILVLDADKDASVSEVDIYGQ